jgi:UDP-N-acetylmuramoyl-tripeptide--D-alanyl-D-alanine ligase
MNMARPEGPVSNPGALAWTFGDIAAAVGGQVVAGRPDGRPTGWSIDSRTIHPGDLFFAIRGARFDGHLFVPAAIEAGAAAVVVTEAPVPAGAPVAVIRVGDTTRALQALAREVRRRSGARVVAITGSAGKTTTKETAAEFLALRYRVFRNRGNLNNHIGLPLSLLELVSRPDVAVVELGMNHAGEIRTLVGIAEPDVRVWTNVAEVHTEFFASLDAVADAKAEILDGARPTDLLVANADDPLVSARRGRFPGRTVTFGFEPTADVSVERLEDLGLGGMRGMLAWRRGSERVPFHIPLLGRVNVANLLAAAAIALEFDVPLASIGDRAASLAAAAHRGEVVQLGKGITVLDDSYNSNPRALRALLDVIRAERGRRSIAVLGEMLELGESGIPLHEACGAAAAAAGVVMLISIGGDAAAALAASAARSMDPARVVRVGTSAEAADVVMGCVAPGDLVFVKGSRGMRTDVVVDRLKAELA